MPGEGQVEGQVLVQSLVSRESCVVVGGCGFVVSWVRGLIRIVWWHFALMQYLQGTGHTQYVY
jgi:hypothetical protein